MSRFSIILELLDCAFNGGMTEDNYHNIVKCLESYAKTPDPRAIPPM